jgi:hypothetical protein
MPTPTSIAAESDADFRFGFFVLATESNTCRQLIVTPKILADWQQFESGRRRTDLGVFSRLMTIRHHRSVTCAALAMCHQSSAWRLSSRANDAVDKLPSSGFHQQRHQSLAHFIIVIAALVVTAAAVAVSGRDGSVGPVGSRGAVQLGDAHLVPGERIPDVWTSGIALGPGAAIDEPMETSGVPAVSRRPVMV